MYNLMLLILHNCSELNWSERNLLICYFLPHLWFSLWQSPAQHFRLCLATLFQVFQRRCHAVLIITCPEELWLTGRVGILDALCLGSVPACNKQLGAGKLQVYLKVRLWHGGVITKNGVAAGLGKSYQLPTTSCKCVATLSQPQQVAGPA